MPFSTHDARLIEEVGVAFSRHIHTSHCSLYDFVTTREGKERVIASKIGYELKLCLRCVRE
jgi:hypothetical protein